VVETHPERRDRGDDLSLSGKKGLGERGGGGDRPKALVMLRLAGLLETEPLAPGQGPAGLRRGLRPGPAERRPGTHSAGGDSGGEPGDDRGGGSGLMNFAWDRTKAARNLAKHGVSFDEAATGFDDPLYLDFFDPEHSGEEHRYIRVGCSEQGRILVVS